MTTTADIEIDPQTSAGPPPGVRFGGVRVHLHPMTLGDNPGGQSQGPPVTLDWNHTESEQFSTIDAFFEQYPKKQSTGGPLYRMAASHRRQILAEDHAEEDILRTEKDVLRIRAERQVSANEPPEGSIKELLHRQKLERLEKQKKQATKRPVLLRGVFSRAKR